MEIVLEFFYFILAVLCLIVAITFFVKSKKNAYSRKSIELLINNFGDKDFSQNKTMLELEEKLEIGLETIPSENKSIKNIIDDAKHKSDILYKHKMAINKPYTELTTFKVVANCVIDHCVKKDINLKESIKLLLLTFKKPYFQEVFAITKTETELTNNFYNLLEGFVIRYKKAIL